MRRAITPFISLLPSSAFVPISLRTSLRTGVWIGDKANGVIDPVHISWTDIAGFDSCFNSRLAAGRVLSMMDMCAACAAQSAVAKLSGGAGKKYLTSTVGVTNTVFSCPILHGDAIRLDGRVIHCGSSSLGIYIRFFRVSPTARTETPAGESFFTMVAITPDLKAAKVVPAVELTDPFDVAMHERYVRIRQGQKELLIKEKERSKHVLAVNEVDCTINRNKSVHVTIKSTKCVANRIFFSSFLNNNNTVFGGELMAWMEQHAVHCGRMLTGNRNVYTIGMHSVAFDKPLLATDWVTLEATVIYIRNTTMEVDVKLKAERQDMGAVVTNRASFVLINNDDIGQKARIPMGIDLTNATQEELQLYMLAKERYHRSVERKNSFKETVMDAPSEP